MTTPSSMRLVEVDTGGSQVITTEVPVPATGEVLVRSLVSGVCGSDTHAAHGRHPFVKLPYRPGHEVVGEIASVADDVTDFAVGTGSPSNRICRAGSARCAGAGGRTCARTWSSSAADDRRWHGRVLHNRPEPAAPGA
jgi:D-arabinose 1-dehydrogenase-like Zn-dependent alcohol dehydrogenase